MKLVNIFGILCLLLCVISSPLKAQTLVTQSIGSTGSISGNPDQNRMIWNVGEVVIGLTQGQNKFNQGIYQFIDWSTSTKNSPYNSKLFTAYPSPTHGPIRIQSSQRIEIQIVDLSGNVVLFLHDGIRGTSIELEPSEQLIDLSPLVVGTYFLVAKNDQNNIQVQKIVLFK